MSVTFRAIENRFYWWVDLFFGRVFPPFSDEFVVGGQLGPATLYMPWEHEHICYFEFLLYFLPPTRPSLSKMFVFAGCGFRATFGIVISRRGGGWWSLASGDFCGLQRRNR